MGTYVTWLPSRLPTSTRVTLVRVVIDKNTDLQLRHQSLEGMQKFAGGMM